MRQVLCILLALITLPILGQDEKVTLSGHVKSASDGEELIGANVYVDELKTGVATNVYGFYSITVPKGSYTVVYSYLGHEVSQFTIELNENKTHNIELPEKGEVIKEIEISAERENSNVESVEMSTVNLQIKTIKQIPALMGEVDVIKAIQLLPGVQTVGEGQSGFYVRGGAVDQNLILLDEAPVYNASHLLGFFSVFNPDAIKDVQLYKGGIPAEYGGRLSSVLDIRMNEGNSKRFSGAGGIGTISSRLTLEGPIVKDKGSFMISGRRTYADLFLKLSSDTAVRDNQLYFYDANLKANYRLGEKDRIFVSGYFGRDVFSDSQFRFDWGNQTATARWNHVYGNKLFSNLTFIYSNFDYSLGDESSVDGFTWKSNIQDYSGKLDFNYFLNANNTVKFGIHSGIHKFNPGVVEGRGDDNIFNRLELAKLNTLEHGIYVSNEQRFGDRLSATYGLRFSLFQNIGPATVFNYDDNYEFVDSVVYEKGDIYNSFSNFEPRLGLKYTLDEKSSVKLSYNRTAQYVHLASNTTASSPLDIWFPSSTNVDPQIADQVAVGYFRNFADNSIEGSLELYYKKMQNSIDFKDHAQLLLNRFLEGELRFGESRSYGAEFMIKKQEGKLNGWVSYTLARTERKIEEINNGEWYPTKYDKTHDVSVVANYDISPRLSFGFNWVYSTGSAVTMPTGRYYYQNMYIPVYSERNGARMPDYHRLDLALTLRSKVKPQKNFNWDLVFSVYNAYNRHNAYSINFEESADNPNQQQAVKTYLFPIIPSLTWNFNF